MILVVTHGRDLAADLVIRRLHDRSAPVLRLDTDRLGTPGHGCAILPGHGPVVIWNGRIIPAAGFDAVWLRRFSQPVILNDIAPGMRSFVSREIFSLLDAVIETVPASRQINPAEADRLAGNRLLQAAAALRHGFRIPESLVTQDEGMARAFIARHAEVITKAISFGQVVDDEAEGGPRFAFTTAVTTATPLDGLSACPSLFQQRVPRAADWRVITVGDRLFAARLAARDGDPPDWRQRPDAWDGFEAASLPAPTATALLDLTRETGLVYGAHDLIETPDGDMVFIETNPAGQWGWLELHAGLPVGDAIAAHLARSS